MVLLIWKCFWPWIITAIAYLAVALYFERREDVLRNIRTRSRR